MLPGEQLGITVLTNGAPVGLADSVALNFFDIAQHGKPTTDWRPLVDRVYRQQEQQGRSPTDYASTPRNGAVAPRAADRYTGTDDSADDGPLTVTAAHGELSMSLGPKHTTFRLTHYDGYSFAFRTVGVNATGLWG